MNRTPIEWTHWSVNALKMRMPDGTLINVCIHKSDGCRHCYAEMIVRRWWKKEWGEFPGYTAALLKIGTPVLVEAELQAVLRLNERIAKGKADPALNRIFWHDMTDEYLDFWPDEFLDKVWAVRALTPNLIHQVLTKRVDRTLSYLSGNGFATRRCKVAEAAQDLTRGDDRLRVSASDPYAWWPLQNAHIGTSVEDQKTADERIPLLMETPAAVRWISAEPLLGPVDLGVAVGRKHGADYHDKNGPCTCESDKRLDWVVVGGESGPNARPFDIGWGRSLIEQCKAVSVPVFMKQLGSDPRYTDMKMHGGRSNRLHSNGALLKNKKGGDINEWPADLRIREFPTVEAT